MIVRYDGSGVHLGRAQRPFYKGCNANHCAARCRAEYLISRLSRVQVVPSLDGLPTRSYSASKLTIHQGRIQKLKKGGGGAYL